jgi:acetyl-CoA synthetase
MSITQRSVYRHADMQRLFNPASIAVIGASPRAGSFADRTISALSGYTGRLYLVNSLVLLPWQRCRKCRIAASWSPPRMRWKKSPAIAPRPVLVA